MGIFVLAEVDYLFCLSLMGLTPRLSIKSIKWVMRYFVNKHTNTCRYMITCLLVRQSVINIFWSRCCDLLKQKYKTRLSGIFTCFAQKSNHRAKPDGIKKAEWLIEQSSTVEGIENSRGYFDYKYTSSS